MIIFIAILALLTLVTMKVIKNDESEKNGDFLSHKSTTIINGIFVLLIFISHSSQYLNLSTNIFDSLYRHFQNFHNQWVVTTFLAFSGYGVMLKIKMEGMEYIRKIPRNRLLKTLVNFDIAVIAFIIVNFFLKIHYDLKIIILSFIGREGIGNSNWYIFSILLMYLFSYLAARIVYSNTVISSGYVIGRKAEIIVAIIVTICAIAYVAIAHITDIPARFVSTIATYSLGMWIAIYKDEIEKLFDNKPIISIIFIIIPIVLTYKLRVNDYIMNINSCFFVLFIVWLMAHFEINSKVFYFLGKHAFSIYILQRIPMNIISHFISPSGVINYIFVVVCLIITIIIAVGFDKFLSIIDRIIVVGNKEKVQNQTTG